MRQKNLENCRMCVDCVDSIDGESESSTERYRDTGK